MSKTIQLPNPEAVRAELLPRLEALENRVTVLESENAKLKERLAQMKQTADMQAASRAALYK